MDFKKIIVIIICIIFFKSFLFAQQNTILIIADDVSPDYFSAFSKNTDTANTPNINTLVKKGIRFNKVWSSPVCSPTRAGIFTGRYSFRTGVGEVIVNASSPQLDTSELSIAKLLKWYAPIKYNTANVGKWHLHTTAVNQRLYPNLMGYDFYKGNFNGAISNYFNYPIIVNGKIDTAKKYATTQTVDDVISWMDTMNSSKPFFLWVAFNAPHAPFHLPPSNLCNTVGLSGTTTDINQNPKKYFKAAIEAMDTEIGRLLQYLNSKNKLDSTNIIFIGDNGNENQVAQISNPKKAKGTIYDYGVRVPMTISGPAVINPGRDCDEPINTIDIFATIVDLSGFYNWKTYIPNGKIVDSKSFFPIIKNQSNTKRTWIFSEIFKTTTDSFDGKTIRNKDFHLLRFSNGKEAFYNQTLDIEENNDLTLTSMTSIEIQNYTSLCDTLNSLISTGNCKSFNSTNLENFSKDDNNKMLFQFSNDELIIDNYNVKELDIYDIIGNDQRVKIENHIDLSFLSNGLYLIVFKLQNGNIVKSRLLRNKSY